ncbi:MAG: hypothetical protein FWG98_11585 [Candidatus Cloacimonetes bacterium]|nr:hypothetical protein [Candidatus Cloacimonadota bacterium]
MLNIEQKFVSAMPARRLLKLNLSDPVKKESFCHCFLKIVKPLPLYALNTAIFTPPPPPPPPPPPTPTQTPKPHTFH